VVPETADILFFARESMTREEAKTATQTGHKDSSASQSAQRIAELELALEERTQQLRTSHTELEAFSYSLSHDMRAPLRAINTLAHVIVEDHGPNLPPEVQDLLERILAAAGRMERMMQDVLAFSRISRQPMEPRLLETDKVIHDVVRERPELKACADAIQIQDPLAPVFAHEPFFAQCVANVLGNAVKFVGPGVKPSVSIWTEPRQDKVRLWIKDNGIGVEPGAQAKIFEIFQRLHSGYDGTGIGLAVVKKAMHRMGGEAGVESEPGSGSRFWLDFPGKDSASSQSELKS